MLNFVDSFIIICLTWTIVTHFKNVENDATLNDILLAVFSLIGIILLVTVKYY